MRKAVRRGAKVFAIGPEVDLTYKVEWLGDDLSLLGKLPKEAADAFKGAERPVMIVGPGALAQARWAPRWRASGPFIKDGWNGFNVLHTAAARMAGLLLGYAQKGGIADIEKAKPEARVPARRRRGAGRPTSAGRFKVYVGHHGDKGAAQADLVLPGAAYSEKHGTYVNIEGRVQRGERAVFPPGDAREDWTIFRALSDLLGKPLPFDSFDQLRAAMIADVPSSGRTDHRPALGAAEARRQGVRARSPTRSRTST